MEFSVNGVTTTLKGGPFLECSNITLKNMVKSIRHNGGGILVQLCQASRSNWKNQLMAFTVNMPSRLLKLPAFVNHLILLS